MGNYAVTGAASGMGSAVVDKLLALGHTVIRVDLRDADVPADLGTAEGRRSAAADVLDRCGGRLDGAVLAAGLGPTPGAERAITEVNYFGVVDLLTAWRGALAYRGDTAGPAGSAKVVVFSSNSTTTVPLVPGRAIRALLAGEADRAVRAYRLFGPLSPPMAYAASKIAVSRWVRRHATRPEWAGAGIRLNALAPGAIMTPMLERQLATPAEAGKVRRFPIPVGGYGDPGQLADWVVFMLSESADFLCGSVVVVDGGSDAYFRADDWPRAVPARQLVSYLRRNRQFITRTSTQRSRT